MESMDETWLYYISCNVSHIHINIKYLIIVISSSLLDMQWHWPDVLIRNVRIYRLKNVCSKNAYLPTEIP
jgi:hypothetical protein